MTDREHAAFRAGLLHAADLALITAMTIEVRPDAEQLRQRAAIEALRGLAEGLKEQAAGKFAVFSQYLQQTDLEPAPVIDATTV